MSDTQTVIRSKTGSGTEKRWQIFLNTRLLSNCRLLETVTFTKENFSTN